MKALKLISHDNIWCVRCGCFDYRFLEINHKNGGGSLEKKNKTYKSITDGVLRFNRNIEDLEILCRPCNAIHYLELKYGQTNLSVRWDQPRC